MQKNTYPVFSFDPADYMDDYLENGYIHIKGGVNEAFLRKALTKVENFRKENVADLDDWRFKKKKMQFLYEFDADDDWPAGIYDSVAATCGLDRQRLTLCERHVKVYDEEADPAPTPHKDRLASTVAVAIPLIIPENSHLILYKDAGAGVNSLQSTAKWRDSLDENELPEAITAGQEPVLIDCQPGDVAMFRGSALLHERLNAANSVLLYLKFNDMGQDPIGEDPFTSLLEQESVRLVNNCDDVLSLTVTLAPRFEEVSRHYTRHHWNEILLANLWAEKPFRISETEFATLRAAITPVPVASIAGASAGRQQLSEDVSRLIKKGALIAINGEHNDR